MQNKKRMNIYKSLIYVLVLSVIAAMLVTLFCGCNKKCNAVNEYRIEAKYDPESRALKGTMTLNYINRSSGSLSELMLLLPPNAFLTSDTAPFTQNDMDKAYPGGFSRGEITVENVRINGKNTEASYCENRQRMLIALPFSLKPSGRMTVTLEFDSIIPQANGRYGAWDGRVNLGNWYPTAAVYKDGGWIYTDYTSIGDPFFTENSNYDITLTLPSRYEAAASAPGEKTEAGSEASWHFYGDSMRDFALVLYDSCKKISKTEGDVTVNCYYTDSDDAADAAIECACDAIRLFGDLFGKYPYKELSIAQTNFFIGGMEYSGLVMIDDSYFISGNVHPLENVTVHETAHQWWYGGAGNDQINEAWIDEGLATYCTMLYYEKYKEPEDFRMYYKYYITNGYRFSRERAEEGGNYSPVMNRPLSEFENAVVYNMLCYEKSAMMFQTIRELIGDDAFFSSLGKLYKEAAGGTVTAEKVKSTFARETTKPIAEVIDGWLAGNVYLP